ncbi:MAG: CPBP family intramembrane metalloprotease [Bacteroidales bacterium]|nr:CPBP family intramembrane metalloprotease [Bacteroidales bacterium]MCM1416767.1 CPBP family intramembrane metalloprotease [bacterium]MCM1424735.1 CPBP family intramembrane metalloprotease [bacterium]
MKKLYEKSEIWFAVLWIMIYVIALSMADDVSASLGVYKSVTALVSVILSVILCVWIKKNDFMEKYGLCAFRGNLKTYLFFLPLVLMVSSRLWGGIAIAVSPLECALHVVSMLGVGFLEEMIFRGFLFKAICKSSVKRAVVISSITFGIGHIVNLLNGQAGFDTIVQIIFAVAVGFCFTIIFYKGKSLLPCIIAHGANNALGVFGAESSQMLTMIAAVVLCVVLAAYTLWIIQKEPAGEGTES